MSKEQLVAENKYISLFEPTESKVRFLASKLLTEKLYLSDEFRDPQMIHKSISQLFANPEANILYEFPDFSGVIGFVNIIPEHKADMIIKIWDKKAWCFGMVKEIKDLIKKILNNYELKRLSLATPEEEKGIRLAKNIFGFTREGTEKYGFRWNNRFYSLCRFRLLAKEMKK